jgi:hypothetical protein
MKNPQHITLKVPQSEDGTFYWHIDIALDSFCAGGVSTSIDSKDDALEAGKERIRTIIQDHLNNAKQTMSERDQQLIINFFES